MSNPKGIMISSGLVRNELKRLVDINEISIICFSLKNINRAKKPIMKETKPGLVPIFLFINNVR